MSNLSYIMLCVVQVQVASDAATPVLVPPLNIADAASSSALIRHISLIVQLVKYVFRPMYQIG
jgi:hypothetical protein